MSKKCNEARKGISNPHEMDGAHVGGVKGLSVLVFIYHTPIKGKEQYTKGGIGLVLAPYLQAVKGFRRACK